MAACGAASDKNRKTDFKEVDARSVLDKLAALPVREWRYTNESAGVKHLGPVAQDFQAAFGLGTDDKTIGTVDADGVALAAIQGLNQKLREELKISSFGRVLLSAKSFEHFYFRVLFLGLGCVSRRNRLRDIAGDENDAGERRQAVNHEHRAF